MRSPTALLSHSTWEALLGAFEEWALTADVHGAEPRWCRRPKGVPFLASVTALIEFVASRHQIQPLRTSTGGGALEGALTLDMSLQQLCNLHVHLDEIGWTSVTALLEEGLCGPAFMGLLFATPNDPVLLAMTEHSGEWRSAICGLREHLLTKAGHRQLLQFYSSPRQENGFYRWHAGYYGTPDIPFSTESQPLPGAHLTLRLGRYLEGCPPAVHAYEWEARLHEPSTDGSQPWAVCCGMVYLLRRVHQQRLRPHAHLLEAAESMVPPFEVADLLGLLEQHQDAPELATAGDFCFVNIWERRWNAPVGCGQKVLTGGLQMLSQRFPSLHTLVVNIAPLSLRPPPPEGEPVSLLMQKLNARDRLEQYLRGLWVQEQFAGERRLIVARSRTQSETLRALGDWYRKQP